MATDFGFFERSLNEKRIYRVTRDLERDMIRKLGTAGAVQILDDTEEHTLVRATNLMDPGSPDGVKPIEDRFGVKLAQEVDAFYRRWNGGVLIYRSVYLILDVQAIIETAIDFRQCQGVPMDLPWHVLRFCDMGSSDHIALRRNTDADWEVIWADVENCETELLYPEDPQADARGILDASFLAWLRRMDETDGWPWGEHIMLPHDKPPCERVW